MKLRCSCGARLTIPFDTLLRISDAQALKFWERHALCREAALTQSRAIESISQTLHDIFVLFRPPKKHESFFSPFLEAIGPGGIIETTDAPDYTEALNKIGEHLSNIECNLRVRKV